MDDLIIDRSQPDAIHGSNGVTSISVFRDCDDAEIFHRRGIKIGMATGQQEGKTSWPVAQLNGVKVYMIDDGSLIMTTQELKP